MTESADFDPPLEVTSSSPRCLVAVKTSGKIAHLELLDGYSNGFKIIWLPLVYRF